jgi:DNA-binding response OmpR family regulator
MLPVAPETIRILVVDDEGSFRQILKMSLTRVGYQVTTACTGRAAVEEFRRNEYDLILLDVMMPEMDGLEVCTEIRKTSDVPIVMLTALSRPDDVVQGFNRGADDYICKPFTFREVEMRLQAILRRMAWIQGKADFQVIARRDIELNDDEQRTMVRGQEVDLTPIEYRLLRELMLNTDRPVHKHDLFEQVWGYSVAGGTNLVEVTVRRLREKIEPEPSNPTYLVTVRGAGYKFVSAPPEREEGPGAAAVPQISVDSGVGEE